MSYNFTKLPEVEVLESLSENAHLIVEDGGNTRRFPANAISGGVSSWNDLTDKPFEAVIELVDVLPETVVACACANNEEYHDDYSIIHEYYDDENLLNLTKDKIKVGSEYYIDFNGIEYVVTAYNHHIGEGEYVPAVGNENIYDDQNGDNEPFFIIFGWNNAAIKWNIDLDSTATIRIREAKEVVKQINAKYVEGAAFMVNVTETYNEEYECNEYVADKTVEEICNAYKSGNAVQAVVKTEFGDKILPLVNINISESDVNLVFSATINGTIYRFDIYSYGDGNADWYLEEQIMPSACWNPVSDAAGETVTAEEFNKLLNELRNCGILPWGEE